MAKGLDVLETLSNIREVALILNDLTGEDPVILERHAWEIRRIITGRDRWDLGSDESFESLQYRIAGSAFQNGWHDRFESLLAVDKVTVVEHVTTKLMLVVSELVEAMEELRSGRGISETYEVDGKPEGFPVELADAVIRLLDMAGMLGIDLKTIIDNKLEFNAGRGKMHGGKVI